MIPLELIARWRRRAADVERFAESAGRALRECADELELALADGTSETLSLADAARHSGFHPDSLGRMIRRGVLQNVGSAARPRVLVAELPTKAARLRDSRAVALGRVSTPSSTIEVAREAIAGRIRPA
jgi:hypothetical protein